MTIGITQDFTVDADEEYVSSDPFLFSLDSGPEVYTFLNLGVIRLDTTYIGDCVAIGGNGGAMLDNRNLIEVIAPTGRAIAVSAAAEIINSGTIRAQGGSIAWGLTSAYDDKIENPGTISAEAGTGLAVAIFSQNSGHVENTGTLSATSINGPAVGYLSGRFEIGSYFTNSGTITAVTSNAQQKSFGVQTGNHAPSFGPTNIVNSGEITADVAIRTNGPGAINVLNEAGGVLNGDLWFEGDPLSQGDQGDLVNNGEIHGDIIAGNGVTSIDTRLGTIDGTVDLAGGDDSFLGSTEGDVVEGGAGDDELYGYAGEDHLTGGLGRDYLEGGADDDVLTDYEPGDGASPLGDALFGGDGADTLYAGVGDQMEGGDGADALIFMFDRGVSAQLDLTDLNLAYAGPTSGWIGADTGVPVTGSVGGVESILVRFTGASDEHVVFTYLGGAFADDVEASDGSDVLRGNEGADLLRGAGGHDLILGGAGADTLFGDAGEDNLTGGEGADVMDGGAGERDLVSYTGSNAAVTVDLSANTTSGGHAGGDVISGFECVFGSAHDDALSGDGAANSLLGQSGADTLIGAEGDDDLVGGADADVLNGGGGVDEARYTSAPSGVVVNLALPGDNTGDAAGDTLISMENITGSNFADALFGNGEANRLDGRGGADALRGGAGNDVYIVDNAGDLVTEGMATGGVDRVEASVSHMLRTNVENLTLNGTAAINATGNALNNILIGNSGANILDGKEGADTMTGGDGNDTYGVDSTGDVITEISGGGGVDQVNSYVNYALGANLENLSLRGNADIKGVGNALNNVLSGNGGDNILDGKEGADSMGGGGGNDTYGVDDAGDVVTETSASGGIDQVNSYANYTLTANVENLSLRGSAHLTGSGNTLNNALSGNSGNNVLDGKEGADTMAGGAGNDAYVVDNTGDVVKENAGAGNDQVNAYLNYTLGANLEYLTLRGGANLKGAGNDLDNIIAGNGGDNVLKAGLGLDFMIGGAGDDLFKFDTAPSASNVDTITDFNVADDGVQLENVVFTTLTATGVLNAAAFHTGAAAHDATDRVIYNSATGALYYDADGSGAGAAVQFAQLTAGLGLTNADIFVV